MRATTRTGLALAVAVLAVSLGGGAAAQSPEQAPGRTGTPPTALAREGYHLYGRYCLPCHGANGAGIERPRPIGTGPGRPSEKQSGYGPSLRGVGALSADFYLRTGYMPLSRVGVQPHRRANVLLDEREIDALVAYVAWLAQGPKIPEPHPERGSLSEGLQLFTEHCAGCHQVVARGGYVNGAVAPPLEHATPRQIAEAVRIGPYVMPRYGKSDLSDGQLDSIVRYVRYAAKSPNHDGGWGIGFIGPIPEGMVVWFFGALAAIAACLAIGRRLRS